jgi:hypothetical protein
MGKGRLLDRLTQIMVSDHASVDYAEDHRRVGSETMGVIPWRETALLTRVLRHGVTQELNTEVLVQASLRHVVWAVEQMRREDRVGLKIILPERKAPPFKYESDAFMRLFEEYRRNPLTDH